MPRPILHALILALSLLSPLACAADDASPPPDREVRPAGAPVLGLLVPRGPADYGPVLDHMTQRSEERFGPYTYQRGMIGGVPVVVSIAPMDGPLVRSLAAQDMLHHYPVGLFLYAGTSGAHLGPEAMRVGDIVLGAANVNFGSFFMARDGQLVGNEFGHEQTGTNGNPTFYLDRRLLARLACSARRVADHADAPAWLNPGQQARPPSVFYYGVQGTSTMWLANTGFIDALVKEFGVIDEDGDWYSNMAAYLHGIPFVEVSVISNSAKGLPDTARGIPVPPAGESRSASVLAQRLSNAVLVDLIEHAGRWMLANRFASPLTSPNPMSAYRTPTEPAGLLAEGGCAAD